MNKISIIIPSYNRYELCCEAVASVLSQRDQNFEIIIIDDSSTDGSFQKLKARDFPHTTVLQTKTNSGPCLARNQGIEVATGEIIVTLDTDNLLLTNALSTIREVTDRYKDQYKLFFFRCQDTKTEQIIGIPSLSNSNIEISFEDMVSGKINGEFPPVFQRDLFTKDGFCYPETFSGGEGILWLRVLRAQEALLVNQVVQTYSQEGLDRLCNRNTQIKNSSKNAQIKDLFIHYFKDDLLKLKQDSILADECFKSAWYWLLSGNKSEGMKRIKESLNFKFTLKALATFAILPLPTNLIKKFFASL